MILLIILLATTAYTCAASSLTDLGPVKSGMPTPLVCSTFATMISRGVSVATDMNEGQTPTGPINVPYQGIATKGYLPYVEEHREMLADSAPLIACVNNNAVVQGLWSIVLATKDKPLVIRTHALKMYWDEANVPLTRQEMFAIPNLRYAPHMVAIMLCNQDLVLNPAQVALWNAVFASTASIMQAMETEDREAFCMLFKDDISIKNDVQNNKCVVQ